MQLGITSAVAHAVDPQHIAFGLTGAGLPYFGTTAATMAQEAGTATMDLASRNDPGVTIAVLDHALSIQMTYGMLSFLGALHWGFEFARYGGSKGYPLGPRPSCSAGPRSHCRPWRR